MCIFRSPTPTNVPAPPAITPRIEKDTSLTAKKEVIDSDTKADISYGTGAKKTSPGAGKKTGTAALKIKLNTGADTGSTTGGLNV